MTTEIRTRRRLPTIYGVCQVCGKTIALLSTEVPPVVGKHGHRIGRQHEGQCAGVGYPPLELGMERAEEIAEYYRQLLETLRTRPREYIGAAPPSGLTGVNALRARFVDKTLTTDEPREDPTALRISELESKLKMLETRLLEASGKGVKKKFRSARRLAVVGSRFRRTIDGDIYVVEEIGARESGSERAGRRRPLTYLCRNTRTEITHRLSQNEVTRAFNEQGAEPRIPSRKKPEASQNP